jgi:hypothetical protein
MIPFSFLISELIFLCQHRDPIVMGFSFVRILSLDEFPSVLYSGSFERKIEGEIVDLVIRWLWVGCMEGV